MSKFAHGVYVIIGKAYTFFWLTLYRLRDAINPPKANSILFVAHPDDDTLFFHTYIKEHKPYVVLLTTGWSLRRMPGFRKNMKHYGVKYRFYGLKSDDNRIGKLNRYVKQAFSAGNFKLCATHGKDGEYGHSMHKKVHNAVVESAPCPVITTLPANKLASYPVSDILLQEKTNIFKNYYKTELFVLEQYDLWISHERLEKINK